MSNLLPAKVERVWMVDTHGTAVEKKPPAKALTSGQRHYHYRLGLMAVAQFLKSRGFTSTSDSQSTLMYELRQQCWIDIAIKNPANIAYVTSRPGYEYDSKRINAQVTTAKDMLRCNKVIQLVVTTRQKTQAPIYIPLPNDLENPSKHVATQVVATLALLCDKFPELKEAFSKANPDDVPIPDTLPDDGFMSLLET